MTTTGPHSAVTSLELAREFCAGVVAERWPGTTVTGLDAMRGDASTRSYARAHLAGGGDSRPATLVVMMMQDAAVSMSSEELGVYGKDGPKELAFVNVGRFLGRLTDAVPIIHAVSPDARVMLLEDVGDTPLWDAAGADPEDLFGRALDLLADLQSRAGDDGSGCYAFAQSFDERLFAWEFEHFLEYGVVNSGTGTHFPAPPPADPALPDASRKSGTGTQFPGSTPADPTLLEASRLELQAVAARLAALPRVFAHRDYHAWNIHVEGRGPAARLRIIDFQDALLAPALYDVASLLTDRITPERITPDLEETLLARYFARQTAGRLASLDETRAAYRLVALQRVLKVVGRFHYLNEVKGKPHYLGFLPAVCRTARRLLATSEGVSATAELFRVFGKDPSRDGDAPAGKA